MSRFQPAPTTLRPSAAVVVPTHRLTLDIDQAVSLRHLRRHLGSYDTYLVLPEGLAGTLDGLPAKRFDARFFVSRRAHQRLLLNPTFYAAFSAYDYVLVYHLDSIVLNDDLQGWCQRGYDFVGAPWTRRTQDGHIVLTGAGNGGFSLRRVSACLEVLEIARRPLARLRTTARFMFAFTRRTLARRTLGSSFLFEDKFWSYEAPQLLASFRVAPAETALEFAFETEPRFCYERNDERLPFGCHRWAYDRAFWEPYLLPEAVA